VRLITVVALVVAAGCVNTLEGSDVQFDFSVAMPVLATAGGTPTAADQIPSNNHFVLYAFQNDESAGIGRLFEVQRFEIHRVVDLRSPCFIDTDDGHHPYPGIHVSQYAARFMEDYGFTDVANPPPGATERQKIDVATAIDREMNVGAMSSDLGLKAVTSVSAKEPYMDVGVASDCSGAEADKIPPPMCMDNDSNKRRLAVCSQIWKDNPDYYEGTDRVLVTPLDGTTYGFVDGTNPISLGPTGGVEFFVDEVLTKFDGYVIYLQQDDQVGPGGTILLYGTPTHPTRGVTHVHMTSTLSPLLFADMAIFADLANDGTHF
jgi:hypothetical protein